ncbi:LysR family transcriptional regulator [Exilibacterium tricleocarpae]|uniref:LysR family transcriptional regulator n=1 Tax=Exilibacterium tricleocarpae TaxID=2591008 RepID=A0A545SPS6_9GAMM|nr:LysR substrate-binding domain-containing protein [Exilibacterium tricleocarpae]TQV66985.1 LysR family transcriptional regulator [Exilibacterium tricleocarpae]
MTARLTLDALEVLDAIDREGSFAAAAAALYRVPSAVTYTVRKLEQDLDVTLFRREGRRSVLTPAGRVLLEQGRDLLAAAERLVETTRQVGSGWESCLTIAVDSILPTAVIYPQIQAFYDLKPDIEISLYEEVLGGSWEAVIEERADLALAAPEPPANTRGLRYREIMQVEWAFVVPRRHPLIALGRPLEPADLQAYRAVVVRDSSRRLPPLTRRVFDRQAVLRVPTVQQKIDAQVQGLGVGFLPLHRIERQLRVGDLVALPLAQPTTASPLHLVWKANNKGKALGWFVERLSVAALGR